MIFNLAMMNAVDSTFEIEFTLIFDKSEVGEYCKWRRLQCFIKTIFVIGTLYTKNNRVLNDMFAEFTQKVSTK